MMKKKYKNTLIIIGIFTLIILWIIYDCLREVHVDWELDSLRAYKINNRLFLRGEWIAFGISPHLTSCDYRIENNKLIISLFARSPSFKSPYFNVYLPISKIPDKVYVDYGKNKIDELDVMELNPSDEFSECIKKKITHNFLTAHKKKK